MSVQNTVDIIIRYKGGILLIKRKHEPFKGKWAIPGGHLDEGESLEQAAVREAKEETGLDVKFLEQLHTYSDLQRDPRGHFITTVFYAEASGDIKAGDDAKEVEIFHLDKLPELAFDHKKILMDYNNEQH